MKRSPTYNIPDANHIYNTAPVTNSIFMEIAKSCLKDNIISPFPFLKLKQNSDERDSVVHDTVTTQEEVPIFAVTKRERKFLQVRESYVEVGTYGFASVFDTQSSNFVACVKYNGVVGVDKERLSLIYKTSVRQAFHMTSDLRRHLVSPSASGNILCSNVVCGNALFSFSERQYENPILSVFSCDGGQTLAQMPLKDDSRFSSRIDTNAIIAANRLCTSQYQCSITTVEKGVDRYIALAARNNDLYSNMYTVHPTNSIINFSKRVCRDDIFQSDTVKEIFYDIRREQYVFDMKYHDRLMCRTATVPIYIHGRPVYVVLDHERQDKSVWTNRMSILM